MKLFRYRWSSGSPHFTAMKLAGYLPPVLVFLDTGDLWVIPVYRP